MNFSFKDIKNKVKDVNAKAEQNQLLEAKTILMSDIVVSENVRKHWNEDSILELAESIESVGQLAPITVRKHPEMPGKWIIVTGERRYRAIQYLKQQTINAVVDDGKNIRAKQLVENIQRENMNILDIGQALQAFIDREHLKTDEVGKLIGKDRRFVNRALLAISLPEEIQELCIKNVIRDATATEKLARLFEENPEHRDWLINEINLIVKTGKFDPKLDDVEAEDAEPIENYITISRAIVCQIEQKLKAKFGKKTREEEPLPLTKTVPLTLANASRLRNVKAYKKYRFNGLNARMNCVFTDPESDNDKEYIGYDDDPMQCAQVTTISTGDPDIAVIEYRGQLFEIPWANVVMMGIHPLTSKGHQVKVKKEK